MQGDSEGETADYTAAIELEGAPPDQVAKALYNRGVCRRTQGDSEGEIANYTAAIELDGAPPDQMARAFFNAVMQQMRPQYGRSSSRQPTHWIIVTVRASSRPSRNRPSNSSWVITRLPSWP